MLNAAYQIDNLKTRQAGLTLMYANDSSETSTDIFTHSLKIVLYQAQLSKH